jgi:hypothetical protein
MFVGRTSIGNRVNEPGINPGNEIHRNERNRGVDKDDIRCDA